MYNKMYNSLLNKFNNIHIIISLFIIYILGTIMSRTMIRARPARHDSKTYAQQLQELQRPVTVKPRPMTSPQYG